MEFARDCTLMSGESLKMSLFRKNEKSKEKEQRNVPIVRNTVQRGSRDVVRRRVVSDFRDIREGIVVQKREGSHIEKLYLGLTENRGRIVRVLLPKPEENLNDTG